MTDQTMRFTEDADGVWVRTPEGELCGPYSCREEAWADLHEYQHLAPARLRKDLRKLL